MQVFLLHFFAGVLNVPKKSLIYCGVIGAISYTTLKIIKNEFIAYLLAGLIAMILSDLFAKLKKVPSMIFLTPSVLVLVPGIGLYNSICHLINNDFTIGNIEIIKTCLSITSLTVGICGGNIINKLSRKVKVNIKNNV